MTKELVFGDQTTKKFDATYILYTWNQESFVEEAVLSALGQTNCKLEILISDDASTDGTFAKICNAVANYHGPHHVRLRQSPKNLRMDHFPYLLKLARCNFVIHAHGDDIAFPNRASKIIDAFKQTGASVVSSNAILIDASGKRAGKLIKSKTNQTFDSNDLIKKLWRPHMTGAFLALQRDVYTRLPWLDSQYLSRGHDHLVPWRGTLLDGFHWIAEPLLLHRMHDGQWRHRFYDESATQTQQETVTAQQLIIAKAKQRDVEYLLNTGEAHDQAALLVISKALTDRIAILFDQWLGLREDLIRQGRRPLWTHETISSGQVRRRPSLKQKINSIIRKANPFR